jgi:RNA polymerase sigma-70 factor, ECF subfamily
MPFVRHLTWIKVQVSFVWQTGNRSFPWPYGDFVSPEIHGEILACLPNLRAFASSLTGNRNLADDLVQNAVLGALNAASQYTSGTNFRAWIFTILRNLRFNEFRRDRGLMRPFEAADLEIQAMPPAQLARLEFGDFRRAFSIPLAALHEALVLVGAEGFRYDEAATIFSCPIGTIKGPVFRARSEIKKLLGASRDVSPATDQSDAGDMPQRRAARYGRVAYRNERRRCGASRNPNPRARSIH